MEKEYLKPSYSASIGEELEDGLFDGNMLYTCNTKWYADKLACNIYNSSFCPPEFVSPFLKGQQKVGMGDPNIGCGLVDLRLSSNLICWCRSL